MFVFSYLLALLGAVHALPHTSNFAFNENFVYPNERSNSPVHGRIIGGQEADPHAYPYIVGIYVSTIGGSAFCGGSLVSKNYVLTAAHCVDQALSAELIFGAQDISDNEQSQVRQTSQEFIVHSGWDRNQLINDIAFIKLSEPIEETDDIRIITIADGTDSYAGDNGIIAGWGRTYNDQDGVTPILRYVISNILTNDECKSIDPYAGVIQPTHLCLSGYSGTRNVGSCNGDSGGPLSSNGIQIGVVSFGYNDCEAGKPSVFTRLTEFKDWIRQHSDVDV